MRLDPAARGQLLDAPPTEPAAPTTGSAADPCGALTADEQTALIAEARDAKHAAGDTPTRSDIASSALTSNASKQDDTGTP